MFSLFHKSDSAVASLATDKTACEASSAAASSGQAGAGISPQPERPVPQESAVDEAGREPAQSAADGRETMIAEAAPAKPVLPDRRVTPQTSVRAEGGKSEGASLSTEAPGAMWGQTSGVEPLLLQVGDAPAAHNLELPGEEGPDEDAPADDDALGIGAPLPPPGGPRRPPQGRQLRVPAKSQIGRAWVSDSFTPPAWLVSRSDTPPRSRNF